LMWLLLIPAFFFGLAGGDQWDILLRWVNQVPFGATDPVFGRDIGFYFFTLPVLEFMRGWLLVALIVIAIGVVVLYFVRGVVGVAALACFANAFRGTLWILGGAIVLWFAASLVVGGIYPALIQNFIVSPDPLNKERVYIARNIQATRAAYSLDAIDESAFDVGAAPTVADVRTDLSDITTVRLWDYRPLLSAFTQLQGLRQYYTFNDVDIDRYQIGGKETPVFLSARELSSNSLPAQGWLNRHLIFTHGFGAVATAVGAVDSAGKPLFAVSDIPPVGEPKIDQPRIYYGELASDYVIVDTNQPEFDYTTVQGNVTTQFSGTGGVGIGSLWDRILFTLRLGDFPNLLVSNQITSDSRLLFHRPIVSRERLIAPFLEYDPDPYLVIANGKLYWI